MSKVIALFNQSGGVGKTTLTMNLGYHLSQKKGNRVLLIDMDPQSSLTTFMGLDPFDLELTIYDAILKGTKLPIHEEIHGMDLVPANIQLSATTLELASAFMREMKLKDAIAPAIDQYDFILIDCPPSLELPSVLSLVAATHVLVPIQTQFKSFQGTDLLLSTVEQILPANPNLKFAGFIPTMLDARTSQESRTYKAIVDQLSDVATVFPPIPKSIIFADASEQRVPLAKYNAKHPAVPILKKIASALEKL